VKIISKFLIYCVILLCATFATAQTVSLAPVAKQIFFGTTGNYIDKPLAGGKIYTYAAGTTTKIPTYTDSTGSSQNTNPIILDSAGFCCIPSGAGIWLTEGTNYKFVVQDATGVQQYVVNNIVEYGATPSCCPLLSKVDITPSSVAGGASSTGTVTLTAAPATNANVSLSSNSSAATVPATVTVLAGNTSATFTVNTIVVGSTTTATVTGLFGLYQTDTLQVTAAPAPIFGGVGSAGATSSVTPSGSTVILSTGDVLATLQTTPEVVGNQWSFNPSTQVIYLLLFGGSHTFTDANTGFPFVFNAPISVTVGSTPMFLYQSTNLLVGNYKPKVAS